MSWETGARKVGGMRHSREVSMATLLVGTTLAIGLPISMVVLKKLQWKYLPNTILTWV